MERGGGGGGSSVFVGTQLLFWDKMTRTAVLFLERGWIAVRMLLFLDKMVRVMLTSGEPPLLVNRRDAGGAGGVVAVVVVVVVVVEPSGDGSTPDPGVVVVVVAVVVVALGRSNVPLRIARCVVEVVSPAAAHHRSPLLG